jgi:hypothetical protein
MPSVLVLCTCYLQLNSRRYLSFSNKSTDIHVLLQLLLLLIEKAKGIKQLYASLGKHPEEYMKEGGRGESRPLFNSRL